MKKIKKIILDLIPPQMRHKIVELKNNIWGGWKRDYYSHNGEDLVVNNLLGGKKTGFYVDVGAHHPRRYSNTALLYERGWKGINIDPNSSMIKLFNKHRTRDINLNVGVGSNEGEIEFYSYSDPAFDTFSESEVERLKSKKWLTLIGSKKIKVRRLSSILNEYLPLNTKIDFLNVDVEGLDLDALKSNDWDKFRPHVIAVEDLFFDVFNPNKSKIYNFLMDIKYTFVARVGLTSIFIDSLSRKTE